MMSSSMSIRTTLINILGSSSICAIRLHETSDDHGITDAGSSCCSSGGDGRFVQAGVLAVAARNGKTAWLAQMAKMQQAGPGHWPRSTGNTRSHWMASLCKGKSSGSALMSGCWTTRSSTGRLAMTCSSRYAQRGSSLLLVNLGWVPAPSDRSQLPNPAIPAAMTLEGVLRMAPGGFLLGQNIEPGPTRTGCNPSGSRPCDRQSEPRLQTPCCIKDEPHSSITTSTMSCRPENTGPMRCNGSAWRWWFCQGSC